MWTSEICLLLGFKINLELVVLYLHCSVDCFFFYKKPVIEMFLFMFSLLMYIHLRIVHLGRQFFTFLKLRIKRRLIKIGKKINFLLFSKCVKTLLFCAFHSKLAKIFFFVVSILPLAVHGCSDTPPVVTATVPAVGVRSHGL